MNDTRVPAFPNVLIVVTDAAVMVDGEVVDRGSAGDSDASVAIHLGVHAAARRVAQRLGRPVRATLRCKGEEKRLIVYPDGSVSDAEDAKPPPRSVSVAAPGARAIPVPMQRRRPVRAVLLIDRPQLATVVAYVAVGAVLVGGLLVEASSGEDPQEVAGNAEPPVPAQVDVELDEPALRTPAAVDGTELERLPGVRDVVARSGAGGFRLQVTTGRAIRVNVLASSVSGVDADRLWTIRTSGATTRTLAIDDLAAGTYRWVVRSPGERPTTGSIVVRPSTDPVVSTTPDQDPTPDSVDDPTPQDNDSDSDSDNGGGSHGGGATSGPTGPVDPDDPTVP
jgi:hypothetical protein